MIRRFIRFVPGLRLHDLTGADAEGQLLLFVPRFRHIPLNGVSSYQSLRPIKDGNAPKNAQRPLARISIVWCVNATSLSHFSHQW